MSTLIAVVTSAATWAVRDGRAIWNGETLDHWCGVLVGDLARVFEPAEIWLFGSVARGDDNGDSDLDLLVVLDDYDPANSIALKRRAADSTSVPAPFDVAFSDPERMRHRRDVAGTIERAATRDGRREYLRA